MAFHPLLSLAFVSVVYFVVCVNCLKPQVPLAGGFYDIDVNSKIIKALVNDIPKRFNELADHEIVEVISAKGQVVAGFKYVLTVKTRPKNTNGSPTQECTLTIWDRPWLQSRVLLDKKCVMTSMPMTGGWAEVEINESIRKAAGFGMSAINSRCNCFYMRLISKINKVQTQVVAGLMYKMHVTVTDTVCRNNVSNFEKNFQQCQSNPKGMSKDCEMTVLSQPWKSPAYTLVGHTCN